MRQVSIILLTLPDGRIVFQRRGKEAPISPGLLGFFGGHVEDGESADAAMIRELGEETSLRIDTLTWGFIQDFEIAVTGPGLREKAIFHLYWAEVPDADFEVFEGVRAEAYTRQEALKRKDIAPSVHHVIANILKEK